MSESTTNPGGSDRDAMYSALFASMVMQQSNMALIMLGRVPHPETGQRTRNLDAARMFIDQLEMLEAKTKGNLDADESALLKESLTSLRMAFVQSLESPEPAKSEQPGPSPSSAASPPPGGSGAAPSPEAASPSPAGEEESRKKFTKKY